MPEAMVARYDERKSLSITVVAGRGAGALAGNGQGLQPVVDGVEASVGTLGLKKLLVLAHFHDVPVVQDHYLVGIADGGQAMGYDDGGTALEDTLESLLNQYLSVGVYVGGGFVQDENLGVSDDGPGEAEKLTLTHAEIGCPVPLAGHRSRPPGP